LYLEGDELFSGGGKMKTIGTRESDFDPIEAGTGLWFFPNTGANNSSGFSGVPGGRRNSMGRYYDLYFLGLWWADPNDPFLNNDVVTLILNSTNDQAFTATWNDSYVNRQTGVSVRCLKD
jgi:hypothetical protein